MITNQSQIVLVIIYQNQKLNIKLTPDLIYNKLKKYEILKVQIINQQESIKSFVEFKSGREALEAIHLHHNTFDFFCKWKMYISNKKHIIISNKNSYLGRDYQDVNKPSIGNISTKHQTSNGINSWSNVNSPKVIINSNFNNFGKISKYSSIVQIENPNIKEKADFFTPINKYNKYANLTIEISNLPDVFTDPKTVYNFFSHFGNINFIIQNNESYVINYLNLIYFEKINFLKYIFLYNKIIKLDIINSIIYDSIILLFPLKKYHRFNNLGKNRNIVFPAKLVKISNLAPKIKLFRIIKLIEKHCQFEKIK